MWVSCGGAFPVEGTASAKRHEWDPAGQCGWEEVGARASSKALAWKCRGIRILQDPMKTSALTLNDMEKHGLIFPRSDRTQRCPKPDGL